MKHAGGRPRAAWYPQLPELWRGHLTIGQIAERLNAKRTTIVMAARILGLGPRYQDARERHAAVRDRRRALASATGKWLHCPCGRKFNPSSGMRFCCTTCANTYGPMKKFAVPCEAP